MPRLEHDRVAALEVGRRGRAQAALALQE